MRASLVGFGFRFAPGPGVCKTYDELISVKTAAPLQVRRMVMPKTRKDVCQRRGGARRVGVVECLPPDVARLRNTLLQGSQDLQCRQLAAFDGQPARITQSLWWMTGKDWDNSLLTKHIRTPTNTKCGNKATTSSHISPSCLGLYHSSKHSKLSFVLVDR